MAGKALEFTDGSFGEDVLKADVPVLVDFWAPWCPPCRRIGPMIEELAQETEGVYKVGKVNVDENQQVAASFNIFNIPALLVFKNGQVVERFEGIQPKDRLQKALSSAAS